MGEKSDRLLVSLRWQTSASSAAWSLLHSVTRPNRVHLCCGSQASRASPWGLLPSAPGRLHDGHDFVMLFTFQFSREARLGLTHQRSQRGFHLRIPLRSFAVCLPRSQPGTGNNLKDLKEPKQAGWNFGFRASLSAIQACPLRITRHGTSTILME